jgi:hypothetical protein
MTTSITSITITRLIQGSGLALATLLITLTATAPAKGQYKPGYNDGIAASPKVCAQLNERFAKNTTRPTLAATMACPKCQDTPIARADTNPKASGSKSLRRPSADWVPKHLCERCGADWMLVGTGKAKLAVAAHTCGGCGTSSLACCSTDKVQ